MNRPALIRLSIKVVTANAISASGAVFPHVWLAAGGLPATGLTAAGSQDWTGGWATGSQVWTGGWTMVAM